MAVQTALRIQLANRPGELARVAQAMGEARINLTSATGMSLGEAGAAVLLPSDAVGATRGNGPGGAGGGGLAP